MSNLNKIFKFIFIIYFILINNNYSQNASIPITYPKPSSVWEFDKYGSLPVDEYRGLANIGISIYNLNVDNFKIPLNLSYFSGGIKVSEEASIVGLGWNFSLPTIVQEVKDKMDYDKRVTHFKLPPFQGNPAMPDSGQFLMSSNLIFNSGSYGLTQHYQLPELVEMPYMKNVIESRVIDHNGFYNLNWKYRQVFEPSYKIIDTEPDIFTVNINGDEIKFCRSQSNNESVGSLPFEVLNVNVINGKTEYKVDLIISDVQVSTYTTLAVSGFKVTDPYGNRYFFDKIEWSDNYNITQSNINTTHYFYKLTKVITSLNKVINFNYTSPIESIELGLKSSKYAKVKDVSFSSGLGNINFFSSITTGSFFCGGIGNYNASSSDYYCVSDSKNIQKIHYLSSIITPNETIIFSFNERIDNTTKKKLESIEVKNIFNEKVKKFNFNYDYFTSNDGSNTKRLKLLSVEEEGKNPYIFEYNPINLPNKNTFSIDYWGFYNGHNNSSYKPDLVDLGYPQYNENISNNFNSNLIYTKACVLEKIIYPTMGYSLLEYELNQFDNLVFDNGNNVLINSGAGLRIKTLSNYDSNNSIISKKSYEYFNGKSIVKRILTKEVSDSRFYATHNTAYISSNKSLIIQSFGNFINSAPNSENEYIGYDKVIIKEIGSENNGKIERKFSNIPNQYINPHNIFLYNVTNYGNIANIENGKLLEETIYDSQEVVKSIKKIKYKNFSFMTNSYYGMSIQSNGTAVTYYIDNGSQVYMYYPRQLATFYAITGKTSLAESEEFTEFYSGSSKTLNTFFDYDGNKNIMNKITIEDNAQFNYRNVINENIIYNISNNPTYKEVKQNGITKTIEKYTYDKLDDYYFQLKKIDVFPKGNLTANNNTLFIDLYDINKNIIQYHYNNNISICTVWGYNNTLPIAKIENVNYTQIQPIVSALQQASNSNNENNLLNAHQVFRNTINSQYPNSNITTYTYKPLIGISSITDSKGDKISYYYDSNGKLIFIKDKEGSILKEYIYNYKQ